MEWFIWAIISGVAIVLLGFGLLKIVPKKSKTPVIAIGLIIAVVGALPLFGVDYSAFSVTGTDTTEAEAAAVADTTAGTQRVIATLTTQLTEAISGSKTAVNGQLRFYDATVDLSDPNVAAIDTITVASGSGSSTAKVILTDTEYRVVFVNGTDGNFYNEDFGVLTLSSNDWSQADGALTLIPSIEIVRMANMTDPLNEAATSGIINGQTNVTAGASVELQGDASPADDEVLNYDESEGDASYYLDITLGADGANQRVKEMVLCFQGESGASPEGNEITSIAVSHQSGISILTVSELVSYFNNEACVQLGDVNGGQSGVERLTFTVVEANLDTNDDYKIIVDDLGAINGKGVLFSTAGGQEAIDMDAQA